MLFMLLRPQAWPSRLERFRSLARTTVVVAGALLVAFHGWLFASQMAAGRFEDPWLVFRWIVAAGLVAAFAGLRRRGISAWSRQGIAVWVLAALLHGPAVATDLSHAVNTQALPETVATLMLQQILSVSAVAITLWLLAGLLATRRDRHARLYACPVGATVLASVFGDGFSPHHSSRPPPHER